MFDNVEAVFADGESAAAAAAAAAAFNAGTRLVKEAAVAALNGSVSDSQATITEEGGRTDQSQRLAIKLQLLSLNSRH